MCCRYIDNMTSERVDAEGISNIAKAAEHFLPAQRFQPEVEQVLSMRSAADLEVWEKLDDTIMGGKSGSYLQTAEDLHGFQGDYKDKQPYDFEGSVWRGETITDGGGFCGARTKVMACCSFSSSPLLSTIMLDVVKCMNAAEFVAIFTLCSHAVTLQKFCCACCSRHISKNQIANLTRTGCGLQALLWQKATVQRTHFSLQMHLLGVQLFCRCWI